MLAGYPAISRARGRPDDPVQAGGDESGDLAGPGEPPITGASMSVPGWLAAENPDPAAPRDPRASRGMAVIRSGDRRCVGGPAREKVAGTCFTAPAPRLYAVEGRNGPFSLGATVRGSGSS